LIRFVKQLGWRRETDVEHNGTAASVPARAVDSLAFRNSCRLGNIVVFSHRRFRVTDEVSGERGGNLKRISWHSSDGCPFLPVPRSRVSAGAHSSLTGISRPLENAHPPRTLLGP
jgi:hypothetical protein